MSVGAQRLRGTGAFVAGLLLVGASAVSAQQVSVGTGVDYLGYTFEDGLDLKAAQLFLVPVALRVPAGDRLTFDIFAAWAEGRIEQEGGTRTLSGPIDTSLRAAFQATPWAQVAVGVNLPTGDGTHDGDEAVVASVLSTDLLGFRESTWGTGLAVTSSVGVARQVGGFGVGVAAAYAARGGFEPSEDVNLTYQPGNEARVRVGIDRNFGNSTLTVGGTFVNYAHDRASDGGATDVNLFQAGNRIRVDASYSFRAGAGVWTLYAADLIRARGDRLAEIIDESNTPIDSTFVQTASQNLLTGGVIGTLALGGGYVFRPHVDFRYQTREEVDGTDAGSGWIVTAGGDMPFRLLGSELFPKARVYFGSMKNATGESVGLVGMEFKGIIRVSF